MSADYILFGEERTEDRRRAEAIGKIDERYLPRLDKPIVELLSLILIID